MENSEPIAATRLQAALNQAMAALLAERTDDGHWTGELSSSALSTATAVTALAVVQRESPISNFKSQIALGLDWLARHVNADGGWGDTVKSQSNLSTTTLGWAAFGAAGGDEKYHATVANTQRWITRHAGGLSPDVLAPAVIARYGKDRTFSAPILTMCALARRLGTGRDAWRHVIPLPFELAACPHQLFAALRLPVVSYALPALIAIGQARHVHRPSRNPIARVLRHLTRRRTLKILSDIQPPNGGFLEATPLTSFVTMSLAGSGQAQHPVTERGVEFLLSAQRIDGSWPIDTNLATWVTTLALNALQGRAGFQPAFPAADAVDSTVTGPLFGTGWKPVLRWLLAQQYRREHPYTHAAPGGWAWTDLPGGVPDADDTAGALLALAAMRNDESGISNEEIHIAVIAGINWLLKLQNTDGGIPTFCRGWGALPFDRSSADITAHVLRAWQAWRESVPALRRRIDAATIRALAFLLRAQRPEGAWIPLWFGNEHQPGDENPVYGTSRVVGALAHVSPSSAFERGVRWLTGAQLPDGGWGALSKGLASVEETSLALEALAEALPAISDAGLEAAVWASLRRGTAWLVARVESGAWREPSPIGFYFAKLWYFERLYPMIFTVGALRRLAALPGGSERSADATSRRDQSQA